MKNLERRVYATAELRMDEPSDDGLPTIRGYAAVFNEMSLDLGGFREIIAPGAFGKSLERGDDVHAFYDHDSGRILGRRSSGTLTLEEDSRGLRMALRPPATETGREVVHLIERGDLDQMSFGFRVAMDEATGEPARQWAYEDGEMVRTLTQVDLFEVSLVARGAYPQTEASVRDLDGVLAEAERIRAELLAPPADQITEIRRLRLRLAEAS